MQTWCEKIDCRNQVRSKLNMENINSWNDIKWTIVDQTVFRLQLRIYKAATEKKLEKMYKLQKTLVSSKFAKYLAVGRVTQDNAGGITSPKEKFDLANKLLLKQTGIPKIEDRAKQMLAYLAMSPQWEAHLEANSYGFKPGRSVQDAMEAVFLGIAKKPKWVLDAYISKCFDEINHQYILDKCETYPQMQKQIRDWLKAGILYGGEYAFPKMGRPQGEIISPLLATIALHGIREDMDRYINTLGGHRPKNRQTTTFVRYADDFVIMHPDKQVILQLREVIQKFLKPIGLKLNPIKTRIVHTLNATEERLPGFTFLGFDVIQRQKRLRQRAGFTDRDSKQDYITLITPSKKGTQAHRLKIREIIRQYGGIDQENLIKKLNPIIGGWVLSKGSQIASKIFQDLDAYLWLHLWKWGRKRHPKMSKIKLKEKYWHKVGKQNWVFGVKDNKGNLTLRLQLHSKVSFHHSTGRKSPLLPEGGERSYNTYVQNYCHLEKTNKESPKFPRKTNNSLSFFLGAG